MIKIIRKYLFSIFFIFITIISFANEDINYTFKTNDKVFTGMVSFDRDRSFYKDGKATGKWISFYENGDLKSIENWENGLLNGKYILYKKNRIKIIEQYYLNGKDHGKYIIYHDNQKPYIVGEFNNGKPSGKWKFYNENGTLYGTNDFTKNTK